MRTLLQGPLRGGPALHPQPPGHSNVGFQDWSRSVASRSQMPTAAGSLAFSTRTMIACSRSRYAKASSFWARSHSASQLECAASVRVDLIGRFTDPIGHVGRINFGINVAADRGLQEIVREPDIVVVALPILPGQRELMAQHVALCKRPEVPTRDWFFLHAASLSGLEAWGSRHACF